MCVGLHLACTSDEWPPKDAAQDESDDDDGGDEAPDLPPPTGVRIEVFEPMSPSIHYLGEPVPLAAEVRDADELPYPFEELVWRAEGVPQTIAFGLDDEVELPPGAYDITAIAKLEDGSRLSSTVGGVRVQSRWTGVYEGTVTMILQATLQGITLPVSCIGSIRARVDYDGESIELTGGSCSINAIIITFDANYELEAEFEAGVGGGVIEYDLGLFRLDFDWTGAFTEDALLGGWEGEFSFPLVGTLPVTGRIDAPRTTPYVEEPA
jgi:hypothetical protein